MYTNVSFNKPSRRKSTSPIRTNRGGVKNPITTFTFNPGLRFWKCYMCFYYADRIAFSYAGLFMLSGRSFRYIVNHTKRIYYSPEETRITYQNGFLCDWLDPLPILMGYGRSDNVGLWLNDVVGVSNEPLPDYTFLPEMTRGKKDSDLFIPGFVELPNMEKFDFEWKNEFTSLILMRGRKYFESGNDRCIQHCGDTHIATVTGTEDYEVEITVSEDGIEKMTCTCPYTQKDNCKHMAAVLFALESGNVAVEELPPAELNPGVCFD